MFLQAKHYTCAKNLNIVTRIYEQVELDKWRCTYDYIEQVCSFFNWTLKWNRIFLTTNSFLFINPSESKPCFNAIIYCSHANKCEHVRWLSVKWNACKNAAVINDLYTYHRHKLFEFRISVGGIKSKLIRIIAKKSLWFFYLMQITFTILMSKTKLKMKNVAGSKSTWMFWK